MSQAPEIKAEVNKEEEKKKGGFLFSLLSRLGGGAGATGGAGAAGAGGLGSAAGGGLLATKAGIIGLALVGTTVAAGIGFVGYKVMAPSSSGAGENTFSIFEARPKAAVSDAAGESGASGESGSLNMFVSANQAPAADGSEASDAPEAVEPKEAVSASKAVDHGKTQLSGRAADVPRARLSGKIGQLGSSGGGGGTSASYSAQSFGPSGYHGGKQGAISGMGGSAQRRSVSVGKGLNSVRRGNSWRSLGNVSRDHRGAGSSQGAGRTYDGNNSISATDAGFPSGEAGQGEALDGDADTTPNADNNVNEQEPPPDPGPPKEVTPWKKALDYAKYGLMAALLLGYLGYSMLQEQKALISAYQMAAAEAAALKVTAGTPGAPAYLAAKAKFEAAKAALISNMKMASLALWAAGILGLAVMAIGITTLTGKHKQGTLGGILALSGALVGGASIYAATQIQGDIAATFPEQEEMAVGTAAKKLASNVEESQKLQPVAGGVITTMQVCGGLAIVGMVGTMMSKPKTYPETDFKDGKAPDIGMIQQVPGAPSETILKEYLA